MGSENTMDAERFPAQGNYWGKQVRVCFNYDTSKTLLGLVVRDDAEAPGKMIIRLTDGRHVLSTECQYQPLPDNAEVNAAAGRERSHDETSK